MKTRPARGVSAGLRSISAPDDVAPYLADAAHYPGGAAPEVLIPQSEADVVAAVLAAREQGVGLLAVGAQSSLTGGATPRGEIVLSTERLTAIASVDSCTVRVGAGAVLADLEEFLAGDGRYYPPTPTYDGATVGGTVATNAAGAATFKYGTTRSWVSALTIVLANAEVLDVRRGECLAHNDGYFEIETMSGERIRLDIPSITMPSVSKCSAGYFAAPGMDLIDLFIGAEGTLGIVTEVELRVLPVRPAWFVALVPLKDEAAALALTGELRGLARATWEEGDPNGLDIAAIEYMDGRSLAIVAEDDVPARVGVALPGDAGCALLLQAELPAATTREAAVASLSGSDGDGPLARLAEVLERHGALDGTVPALPGEDGRRRALFALREAVPEGVNRRVREMQRRVDASISKAAADVVVPFSQLGEALTVYRTILEELGLDHAIWGHFSDANVHPNVIPRNGDEMDAAKKALGQLGVAATKLGGSPMSEHGTGRNPVKQSLLVSLYGHGGVASMKALKHALDPGGLMAPGVLWAADERPEAGPDEGPRNGPGNGELRRDGVKGS